jgi:hypothetical protein
MTILVAIETLLLVLLAVLVAGLLRSHAEILRRLGPAAGAGAGPDPPEAPARAEVTAPDIAGTTLDGAAVQMGRGPGRRSTLLAFLSSGCLTCERFWSSLASGGAPSMPGDARIVAVTKDRSHESPSRLRELAGDGAPVVMSSSAWERYEVPTSPYFVYVDGASGEIQGEGAAAGWEQVASLLRDALDDIAIADGPEGRSGPARANRVDRDLEAAGIHPGHPSLYPFDGPDGPRET